MRDGETQRSRGFAFLTFEKGASVNAVMTREHYLDGKTVSLSIQFSLLIRETNFFFFSDRSKTSYSKRELAKD